MNYSQQEIRLLPRKYKFASYVILCVSILLMITTKVGWVSVEAELVKTIFKSGVLASLLLLALTRDNMEDELTLRIRIKAFAIAFIFGVTYVVAMPFVNLVFDGEFIAEDIGTAGLLIAMFVFYFGMFNLMKRNR